MTDDDVEFLLRVDRTFKKLKRDHEKKMQQIDSLGYWVAGGIFGGLLLLWFGLNVYSWREDSLKYHSACMTDQQIADYMRTKE